MKGRKVPLLQGLGALYGLFDLERGADGFMTGFAFPEVLIEMVKKTNAKQMEAARKIFSRFLPLIVFEQQPGLAIRKEIYRMRGLIKNNRVRHPGATIDKATTEQLRNLIDSVLNGVNLTKPIPV
jgi:4-hydroxy-tetrahydrodipicolinate synthase